MKRSTTKQFISKARKIHGTKYLYSKSKYINSKKKIIIICKLHGEFLQTPSNHLSGFGCSDCARNKQYSTEEFISKIKKIHKGKYDYSLVKYVSITNPIILICPKHGEFKIVPNKILSYGRGCPKCGIEKSAKSRSVDQDKFIEKCRLVHGDKYDYSKVKYKSNRGKIKIICKEHGLFLQNAYSHLQGKEGCKVCYKIYKSYSIDDFIKKASLIHNDKYNYSKVDYKGCNYKVKIICPNHGIFNQVASAHLFGNGCPKCKSRASIMQNKWLDMVGVPRGASYRDVKINIGNRYYYVDGYDGLTNTVYEFYGDFWHGNPIVYKPNDTNIICKKTFGELYRKTLEREKDIKKAGYKLISVWERDIFVTS